MDYPTRNAPYSRYIYCKFYLDALVIQFLIRFSRIKTGNPLLLGSMKTYKYNKISMDMQVNCLWDGAMEEPSVSLPIILLWTNLWGLYVCVTAVEVSKVFTFVQSFLSSAEIILIIAK